jgi:hypothetical protein
LGLIIEIYRTYQYFLLRPPTRLSHGDENRISNKFYTLVNPMPAECRVLYAHLSLFAKHSVRYKQSLCQLINILEFQTGDHGVLRGAQEALCIFYTIKTLIIGAAPLLAGAAVGFAHGGYWGGHGGHMRSYGMGPDMMGYGPGYGMGPGKMHGSNGRGNWANLTNKQRTRLDSVHPGRAIFADFGVGRKF